MGGKRLVPVVAVALVLVFVGLAVSISAAAPGQKDFLAVLNAGQENPPVNTNAFGVAYFTLDGNTLCYSISYKGLQSNEVAAHIHGPAKAGENAGVLIGFPEGDSPKNNCFEIDNATRKAVKSGRAYVNVHTAGNPGGEIRGQIQRVR